MIEYFAGLVATGLFAKLLEKQLHGLLGDEQ